MRDVALALPDAETWEGRRRRARQLSERYPFARQLLDLYAALLEVQQAAFEEASQRPPAPADVAEFAAGVVMPRVTAVSATAGPPALAEAVATRLRRGDLAKVAGRWLRGENQPPAEEYLARSSIAPVLEALGERAGAACSETEHRATSCPRCGGRPQLGYFRESGEALVTAPRRLLCCRCGQTWVHERMCCPWCGERSGARLPVFEDAEVLPHVRADGCESCHRYLITVDLRKEPIAVPLVDELAALPLDLYVQARGFTKVVPNLMGIG
jgi:FdhE protein